METAKPRQEDRRASVKFPPTAVHEHRIGQVDGPQFQPERKPVLQLRAE